MAQYADVIIDLNSEALDRIFQYRIPPSFDGKIVPGTKVRIPFGKADQLREGYVIALSSDTDYDPGKIKEIYQIIPDAVGIDRDLIRLASWMRTRYGSTMNQALKTVLPVKAHVRPVVHRTIHLAVSREIAAEELNVSRRKKFHARARLLEALLEDESIPMTVAVKRLNLSAATIRPLCESGIIRVTEETCYRSPVTTRQAEQKSTVLTPAQQAVADSVLDGFHRHDLRPCLIRGITGSGKTEVYMAVMEDFIRRGKQVILLIPEISLTYQTVMRFYRRFGDRVSVINSKLSAGEKYDQFLRARRGELDIMIGPRSALFTPFPNLGLIVIDEEHDSAYKSELSPKYHARETAIKRAAQVEGLVVMGSATPSVDSYYAAEQGRYRLFSLEKRAVPGSTLPQVTVCDLREELKSGNKSIFSRTLQEKMNLCLQRKEQMMLFLNRRGYAGFISCRSCGKPLTCPHCDVSLTAHRDGDLVCHYCGYRIRAPKLCPHCGSPYIAGFGLGTQKAEAMTQQLFPGIRTLRMDADTTSAKGGHEEILRAFAQGEADVLIGTQMIVKGHDFPNVTLVGILAADMSLHSADYHASEITFQLLTQAAGRAGRAGKPGNVVIQTYSPDHYAICCAAGQDYEAFYRQEIRYRQLMHYPPDGCMLEVLVTSPHEENAEAMIRQMAQAAAKTPSVTSGAVTVIGPGTPQIGKIRDMYRRRLLCKSSDPAALFEVRAGLEQLPASKDIRIQFDFT